MTIRKIGVDPGFDSIKIAEVFGDSILTTMLPSVVGLARERKDGLTLGGVVRGQRRPEPYHIAFDGIEYLVGSGVADVTKPIERMDFSRFSDSPELRAALYTALYKIVNGGGHDLALALALPVPVVQDKDMAAKVEKDLRGWLMGRHQFEVNGVVACLNITNLRAKIAQPVATWFEWGLDNAGQWVRGPKAAKAPVLIIDQGFNTLDVLVVEGGRISDRHSGGDTLGMRRAAERLTDTLEGRYKIRLDLRQANEMIQAVVAGQSVETWVKGEAVDVSREARQALASLEADVIRFVDQAVENAAAYRVLLTGGGAVALASRLRQKYEHAEAMAEPVLANARGLAKMAQRPGFLE